MHWLEKSYRRPQIAAARFSLPDAARSPSIDLASIRQGYRRCAGLYDAVFGKILQQGRLKAVQSANTGPGQRILEIGVGTGLSLASYRDDARVVGIDVSQEMLDKARRRARLQRLTHVEALLEMDAGKISFPDDSFDAVVALYVVTVVPDLPKVAAELRRVCAPGGKIVVVSRFASDRPILSRIERGFAAPLRKIGLSSELRLVQLIGAMGFAPADIRPANLFGYWRMLSFRNEKVQAPPQD